MTAAADVSIGDAAARIEGIFIAAVRAGPMAAVGEVCVLAHKGLAGDRYAAGTGTFSKPDEAGDAGRDVTCIEAEAIEAVAREHGLDVANGRARRNLVTRGLTYRSLLPNAHLVVGADAVVLRVDRTCPPCRHLDRLVGGTFEALGGRGGLRTTVLKGGTIRVGDVIRVRTRREVEELLREATHA